MLALKAAAHLAEPRAAPRPWASRATGCVLPVVLDPSLRVLPPPTCVRSRGPTCLRRVKADPEPQPAESALDRSPATSVLAKLGFCTRRPARAAVAVCVRLRDGRRRGGGCGGALAGGRGRHGAARMPILIDVLTPGAVRRRRDAGEVAVRLQSAAARVHLFYFCGNASLSNATRQDDDSCAMPTEDLTSLLRVALAYALPHAAPFALLMKPLEKLDVRADLKWDSCCHGNASALRRSTSQHLRTQ